ncbi:hypothetical protein KIPB_008798, partial [Kipferlia bialata]
IPKVTIAWYRNAGGNNADLPVMCHPIGGGRDTPTLHKADDLEGMEEMPFKELFKAHSIVMCPTELSATAPMKVVAKAAGTGPDGLRAATMPGFTEAMVPALRLDYGIINKRVNMLKDLIHVAEQADLVFTVEGTEHKLTLDLRHRPGHASGGLFPNNGTAGNLPSGEAYIVPYEGEIAGDASRSQGTMPVQIGDEVVVYRIEGNKAVEVLTDGPASQEEWRHIQAEPAYANLAELGLGVLGDFGLKPTGSILLDEKLGLHIAFGRSDHFTGGTVGPKDFSCPDAVIHLDRVYIPETQPKVHVNSCTLTGPSLDRVILRDNVFIGL